MLGAPLTRYELSWEGEWGFQLCESATDYEAHRCSNGTYGEIDDMRYFLATLVREPGSAASVGEVRLYVLSLPDEFSWNGVRGDSTECRWRAERDTRWHNTACEAEITPRTGVSGRFARFFPPLGRGRVSDTADTL